MKTTALKTMMLFIAVTAMLLSKTTQAQSGDGADKVESLRIAFISQRLNLTPEEAQKFWPVYNQFQNEMKALRQKHRLVEGQPTADESLQFEEDRLNLKKKYKTQFESVIGKEKVNTLYGLEEEFRRKLQEMRQQRQQGNPPAGRPGAPRQ